MCWNYCSTFGHCVSDTYQIKKKIEINILLKRTEAKDLDKNQLKVSERSIKNKIFTGGFSWPGNGISVFSAHFQKRINAMKKLIIVSGFFLFSNSSISQLNLLSEFNKEKANITRQSMAVLAGWGGINLVYSGIASGSAKGSNQYFYRMNSIWGGVNFSIGILGYLFTKSTPGLNYSKSLGKQMTLEKIYLFNTGLDVAYVVGGFYFNERANNILQKRDRFKGYGRSFILQGSALFLYDGIMYFIYHKHGRKISHFTDNIRIRFTGKSVSGIVRF